MGLGGRLLWQEGGGVAQFTVKKSSLGKLVSHIVVLLT